MLWLDGESSKLPHTLREPQPQENGYPVSHGESGDLDSVLHPSIAITPKSNLSEGIC